MTHQEAFIQAIREQPADDAPRLIFADWLDEHGELERAEFIRTLCAEAGLPRSDPRRGPLLHRAEELLEEHWSAWSTPLRQAIGGSWDRMDNLWLQPRFTAKALAHFPRGFVDTLGVEAVRLVHQPTPFAELAPLCHLHLFRPGRRMQALADTPYLAQVETLAFRDYFQVPVNDDGLVALAGSSHLGRLANLSLAHNNVSDDGLVSLSGAPWLVQLRVLVLDSNALTQRGVRALAETPYPPRLSILSLSGNPVGNHAIEALVQSPLLRQATVLNLDQTGISDRAVDVLIAAMHLSGLTRLSLRRNEISLRARARLRLSPLGARLTRLDLDF
jgi:uncharacterized protein (TIGR02996 family)